MGATKKLDEPSKRTEQRRRALLAREAAHVRETTSHGANEDARIAILDHAKNAARETVKDRARTLFAERFGLPWAERFAKVLQIDLEAVDAERKAAHLFAELRETLGKIDALANSCGSRGPVSGALLRWRAELRPDLVRTANAKWTVDPALARADGMRVFLLRRLDERNLFGLAKRGDRMGDHFLSAGDLALVSLAIPLFPSAGGKPAADWQKVLEAETAAMDRVIERQGQRTLEGTVKRGPVKRGQPYPRPR